MDTSPEYFHVLVVDDNIINRKLVEKLLHKSSCKVTAVDSGRRALQVLGLNNENTASDCLNDLKVVDLIMTDYSMPGMTGFELLKNIKSSSTHKDVPVVIMSSENIKTRIRRCLEEGAREYILKPVKLLDIQRVKNSILQTRGAEQEVVEEKIKPITRSINENFESYVRKMEIKIYCFSNESESRGINLPESAGQCSSKVCESSSGL